MAVSVTVTQIPSSASGTAPTWMPVVGQSYSANSTGNLTLEGLNIPLGTATVSGTGLGIDGAGWELAYYNGSWLVHNGNLGTQPTYVTYTLTKPVLSSFFSGALSNTGPLGIGTLGEEIAVGVAIVVIIAIIALIIHTRH